jgi:hypothetical protein
VQVIEVLWKDPRSVRSICFSLRSQIEMDQRLNPYAPGSGVKPLKLAGRDPDIHFRAPFGYSKPGRAATIVPDPATAPLVTRAFELRAAVEPWPRIAAFLNERPRRDRKTAPPAPSCSKAQTGKPSALAK